MNTIENIRTLVLSSILSANDFGEIDLRAVFASGINKDYFEDQDQRIMFEVISVCVDGDIAFDDSVILSYMQKAGVQNPQNLLLHVMAQKQVPQSVLLEQISLLKETYHKKMLNLLHLEISKMLSDENTSAEAISQMVQNSLDGYEKLNKTSSTTRLSEVRKLRKAQPPVQRIKTGIPFIDTVLTDKQGNKGIRNEGLFFYKWT
ncbi:MAG: hypothetical protein Q9M40_07170 [Sulfurimonas sp.]|nr:hypothetical protein [Sulfurimonas sp.]